MQVQEINYLNQKNLPVFYRPKYGNSSLTYSDSDTRTYGTEEDIIMLLKDVSSYCNNRTKSLFKEICSTAFVMNFENN